MGPATGTSTSASAGRPSSRARASNWHLVALNSEEVNGTVEASVILVFAVAVGVVQYDSA